MIAADHRSNNAVLDSGQTDETFDLVVIGAGVAGLNVLYAATHYLPKGAKVLLVDQKQAAGGMWNTAYDYVRLHQPHAMFTVGDMRWRWDKPGHYLAQRDEVRDHLASSLQRVAAAVSLEAAFGHTVVSMEKVSSPGSQASKAPDLRQHRRPHKPVITPSTMGLSCSV